MDDEGVMLNIGTDEEGVTLYDADQKRLLQPDEILIVVQDHDQVAEQVVGFDDVARIALELLVWMERRARGRDLEAVFLSEAITELALRQDRRRPS